MPAPPNILVVEDVAIIRQFVEYVLTRAGYEVCGAEDGAAALHLIAVQKFDAAVLDINLPGLDGFAVAARVRAAAGRPLPTIFMTAQWTPDLPEQVVDAGGLGLLLKPFGPADLLQAVELGLTSDPPTGGASAFGEPP